MGVIDKPKDIKDWWIFFRKLPFWGQTLVWIFAIILLGAIIYIFIVLPTLHYYLDKQNKGESLKETYSAYVSGDGNAVANGRDATASVTNINKIAAYRWENKNSIVWQVNPKSDWTTGKFITYLNFKTSDSNIYPRPSKACLYIKTSTPIKDINPKEGVEFYTKEPLNGWFDYYISRSCFTNPANSLVFTIGSDTETVIKEASIFNTNQ